MTPADVLLVDATIGALAFLVYCAVLVYMDGAA